MKTIIAILAIASLAACATPGAYDEGGRNTYTIHAQNGDAIKLRRDLARCQFDDKAQALMCMEEKGYKLVAKVD
jgi:hypothetical protein